MARTPTTRRGLSAVLVLAAAFALAGCEDTKLLEMFDNKPKLSGTRVPVFPEGVPGVQQGVPPELMRGYHEQVEQQAQTQAAAAQAEQAAAEERKKAQAAAKPKPKPQRVARPRPAAQPAQPQDSAAAAEAPPQSQPTSAPLADRWPSAQQETRQAAPPPPPQQSPGRLLPWPGSSPQASSPPTDRFTR